MAGRHIHHVDGQADKLAVDSITPALLQAALHEGCQDPQGQALQVAPHYVAAVGDQVEQAPQHATPHLGALLFPLHSHTPRGSMPEVLMLKDNNNAK